MDISVVIKKNWDLEGFIYIKLLEQRHITIKANRRNKFRK